MPVVGSSVLVWTRRALTAAVETGCRLLAHAASVSGCSGRPAGQRPAEGAASPVSSGTAQQPPATSPPPVAARAVVAATSEAQRHRPVPVNRAATAPVTPAMVRRWAHEEGIQVAGRGRIPRSVLEQYLAQVASERAPRAARGSAKAQRSPSGGSRSPAA